MPSILGMPDFDLPTRSASGFLLRWIAPRIDPYQLISSLDRKKAWDITLLQADFVLGTGHGSKETFSGQNAEIVLQADQLPDVRGKFFKLLSCQTGAILGPALIDAGALGFQGYTEDFVWVMDADYTSRPWADKMAGQAIMPVITAINLILDGQTSKVAFDAEIAEFEKNILAETNDIVKSCLEFNRDHAIMLGDPNARVRRRPGLALPFRLFPPPPLPPVLGLKS
jgi:hypothetical protein